MDKAKHFKNIMDKTNSNRVVIYTEHYKITGDVYDCEECNRESCVNLVNAKICNTYDVYENSCVSETSLDWLHVNMDAVVAYSFV